MVDADEMDFSEGEEEVLDSLKTVVKAEVDFTEIARELAGNTLKEQERAYKKLIRNLFDNEIVLDRINGLRIWKGLFFMLWHSDGLEVQEKLCERMAALVGKFKIAKNRWTYVQSAIEILNREWLGIDRLRMSKFMLVCRLLLRSSFEVIGKEGWNVADINWFVGVMSVGPLQYHQPAGKSSAPLGIRYHFADIWTEELIRVGGSKSSIGKPLDEEVTFQLISCWCKVATMTNIGAFRNKIKSMVFDDIIERSDVSLTVLKQHAESNPTLADRVAEMEDAGFLIVNFNKLSDYIIELTTDDTVKMKQKKSMNRIVKRFKSLAQGELPLDDISDWSIENDEIDKFLFHTEGGFSKKELKKWDGLKSAKTLTDDITKKLENFLGDDAPDDSRIVLKKGTKRKSKRQKMKERAQRKIIQRKKIMNEILDEKKMQLESNNNEELQIKKMRKSKDRKAATKQFALSILNGDLEDQTMDDGEMEDGEETIEIKPRKPVDDGQSKLAALAERIRLNIDTEADSSSKQVTKKAAKKLKGDDFQFIKLRGDASEPKGTAFLTTAQRKVMKRQKKPKVVSKAAVEIYKKESKLKFNENLVQIKPFKKLDKPEVVGTHQGELNIHNPSTAPIKSALKNKAVPRKIVGNKGKLKWQG